MSKRLAEHSAALFGGDHVQVRVDTGTVSTIGFFESPSCRFDGRVLLLDHLRQDPDGCEIALHLLKCDEYGLPVIGVRRVVLRLKLLNRRTTRRPAGDGREAAGDAARLEPRAPGPQARGRSRG